MGPALQLLVLCTVVLSSWIILHVALVVASVRAKALSTRDRWLSLVPVITPWTAWRAGRHKSVIVWACLIVLYVALRVALAAR